MWISIYLDNTNWRANGPCFQMKNVNFRQAAQKDGLAAAQKGNTPACPFPQISLMCSPPAHANVEPTGPPCMQPAGLPFCAACKKFLFFIWKHGPPAQPALRLVLSIDICLCYVSLFGYGCRIAFCQVWIRSQTGWVHTNIDYSRNSQS